MVNCLHPDTSKGTVKLLQYSARHRQQLIVLFQFTVHTKTYLTLIFVDLLIYILLKRTCYRSRNAFLLKLFYTSLGKLLFLLT